VVIVAGEGRLVHVGVLVPALRLPHHPADLDLLAVGVAVYFDGETRAVEHVLGNASVLEGAVEGEGKATGVGKTLAQPHQAHDEHEPRS
jgi:hypothetical protein